MKKSKVITLAILALSFLLATCKKDPQIPDNKPPCVVYTELKGQEPLADIHVIKDAQELLDTLAKHSNLQLYRVFNDQYSYGMHCRIFHKGLIVFSDYYQLWKSKRDSTLYQFEPLIDSVNISLSPSITFEEAISVAKQHQDYTATCIFYRLGIYDINASTSFQRKNYKLVWRIQGETGIPFVLLDANTGQVYSQDDGKRY